MLTQFLPSEGKKKKEASPIESKGLEIFLEVNSNSFKWLWSFDFP